MSGAGTPLPLPNRLAPYTPYSLAYANLTSLSTTQACFPGRVSSSHGSLHHRVAAAAGSGGRARADIRAERAAACTGACCRALGAGLLACVFKQHTLRPANTCLLGQLWLPLRLQRRYGWRTLLARTVLRSWLLADTRCSAVCRIACGATTGLLLGPRVPVTGSCALLCSWL